MGVVVGASFGLSSVAVFVTEMFITSVASDSPKDLFVLFSNRVALGFLGFHHQHVLEVCDLLGILPKLYILKVLNLLFGDDKLVFAALIGLGKFLLEMFHLGDKGFLVLESFLQNEILFFFTFDVELEEDLVILSGRFEWTAGRGQMVTLALGVVSSQNHRYDSYNAQ